MTRRTTWWLGGVVLAAVLAVVLVLVLGGRHGDEAPPAGTGTSPAPTGAACSADLTVTGTWPGGFGAELVVTAAVAAPDWRLSWTMSGGARVTEAWGGTLVADGADGLPVQVTAPGWDVDLAAGRSATVGFNGDRADDDQIFLDGASLNGQDCAITVTAIDDGSPAPAGSVAGFFVDPDSQAARAAAAAAGGADMTAGQRIASVPQARWITDPDPAVAAAAVAEYTAAAEAAGRTGVLAVYAVPGRDCGAHSAGGTTEEGYRDWVAQVAGAIHGEPWVVLEPDALADLGSCEGQGDRTGMLRDAARVLDEAGARVYLDAGNARWLPAEEAAARIDQVGTDHLTGFALNVSNYRSTVESVRYGEVVSQLTGDLGYLIDTSRNGIEPAGAEWCNVRGAALGEAPHLVEDDTALDAVLWVKRPGESDGTCNGGPEAGTWWPEIARELVAGAGGGQ